MLGWKKDTEDKKRGIALNALKTNVMIADHNFNITYMNPSVINLMRDAEADLKK